MKQIDTIRILAKESMKKDFLNRQQIIDCAERYPLKVINKIKALKDKIKNIKFDCKFENGRCKTHRDSGYPIGCCCSRCKQQTGYLFYGEVVINFNDLPTYIRLYDKETGFYKSKIGCVLPHALRSTVCLGYSCNDIASTLTSIIIRKIHNVINLYHQKRKR